MEEVKKELFTINSNIEILSDTYINNNTKLECRCKIDGHVWKSIWINLQRGIGCPQCKIKNISGENSINYNPNLTDEERERGRHILYENLSAWRNKVYKRDSYTCQCCGRNKDISGHLNAHHLNSYNWDKEHRVQVDNGITLCESCHKEFHLIYGYGDNTKEQYEEWTNKNNPLNDVI